MEDSDKLKKIHKEALERFSNIYNTVADEREQCLEDRRFYSIAGAQWEGAIGDEFQNRTKMEFNKIHMAVIKTVSEMRNNRISVDFIQKDGSEDTTADMCDSLLRADEERSNAQDAYDIAFEEKAGGGFGAWRLMTVYEDEGDPDNENQRIEIQSITDADQSVFFALESKRADKLDAPYAFVIDEMQKKEFVKKYNSSPVDWPNEIKSDWGQYDWATKDIVRVAEYYVKEEVSEPLHYFEDIAGDVVKFTDEELTDAKKVELDAIKTEFTHTRKIKKTKVRKYIMSGGEILEDTGYIAGKHIPIVPDYGKRWVVDGIERMMGRVRLAKDPQRVKNMLISSMVETASRSGDEIPIFAEEQMADVHIQQAWARANVDRPSYLTVKTILDNAGNPMPVGELGYKRPPSVSPALAGLLNISEADIQDILGTQDQGDELKSNLSGEAVGKIHDRLDQKDYIYMDNHAKAHKTSGAIWLSMAQDVYVEEGRKMKTVSPLGKAGTIELRKPIKTEEGKIETEYDLSKANYEVTTSIGASFSSKRKATLNTLTNLLTVITDPQDLAVLSKTAMMNIEGEGVDDLRDYAREQLVKLGVVKPTDEEVQEMQENAANTPPDANQVYLEKAAMNEEAKALKTLADTELTEAKVQGERAKTIKTLVDAEKTDTESGLNVLNAEQEIQRNQQAQTAENGNQSA